MAKWFCKGPRKLYSRGELMLDLLSVQNNSRILRIKLLKNYPPYKILKKRT